MDAAGKTRWLALCSVCLGRVLRVLGVTDLGAPALRQQRLRLTTGACAKEIAARHWPNPGERLAVDWLGTG